MLQKLCGESGEKFQFSAYNFVLGRKKGRLRPRQFAGAVDFGAKSAPRHVLNLDSQTLLHLWYVKG
jgi:hypothetical protein